MQFDGNGNLTCRYLEVVDRIFAEGAVSSPTQADTVTWGLTDNHGSERYLLDNSSAVIDEIVDNEFGMVAYESNTAVHHFAGFAGGHVDPNTGLIENGERWLDAATGEWLSADPLDFSAGDSNLSRYVGNSPTNATDPSGLSTVYDTNVSVGIMTFTNGQNVWATITGPWGTSYGGDCHINGGVLGSLIQMNSFSGTVTVTVTSGITGSSTTSVYSLMVENNAKFAEDAAIAKEQAVWLSQQAVMFSASAGLLAKGFYLKATQKALKLLLAQLKQGSNQLGLNSNGANQVANEIQGALLVLSKL